jgi:hypothetical protein
MEAVNNHNCCGQIEDFPEAMNSRFFLREGRELAQYLVTCATSATSTVSLQTNLERFSSKVLGFTSNRLAMNCLALFRSTFSAKDDVLGNFLQEAVDSRISISGRKETRNMLEAPA